MITELNQMIHTEQEAGLRLCDKVIRLSYDGKNITKVMRINKVQKS